MKRLLLITFFCFAGILVPFSLIYSLPIQNVLVPVQAFTLSEIGISLPEYAKLFFMGIGLIGIGRIGRKALLRK